MVKRTVYRERSTGRFAKKSNWNRSHGKNGKYKRETIEYPEPEERGGIIPPPEEEVFEWIIGFSYDKSGRSFDVIVTARTEAEANAVAREFLRGDKNGQKISKAGYTGWTQTAARGARSEEGSGEAEYRDESEE